MRALKVYLLFSQRRDALLQHLAALDDVLSGAGQIHAAIAVPFLSEEGAVVYGDAALGDKGHKVVAVEAQLFHS